MITDEERSDLNAAIVGYLASQGLNTQQIGVDLNVDSFEPNNVLEHNWESHIKLQKRVQSMEEQIKDLKEQVTELKSSTALNSTSTSLANWLPRWPPKKTLLGHRGQVTAVCYHPDYALLASSDDQSEIKVWDQNMELEKSIKSHTRAVNGLVFAPKANVLISASTDLSLKVFDIKQNFANVRTMLGHEHTVSDVCCVVDPISGQEYAVSASRDHTVRVWDIQTGFVSNVIRGHTDWVRCLAATDYTEGVQYLLSAGSDRTARITTLFGEMEESWSFSGHSHVVECCDIAPSSSTPFLSRHLPSETSHGPDVYFATSGRDCVVCVWSGTSSQPLLRLVGHDNWVRAVKFHPNGRFLVSVGDDKTMRVWDLARGRLVRTIEDHKHFVTCMAWHQKSIATGSADQTIKIW